MRLIQLSPAFFFCTIAPAVAQLSTVSSAGQTNVICDTTFIGPPGAPWQLAANWSSGIPGDTDTACFPDAAGASAAAGLGGDLFAPLPDPPAPTSQGACCLGATCELTDYFDCREASGFFKPGVFFCGPSTCGSGVCCIGESACADDDGVGGVMTPALCGQLGGNYLGSAACGVTDPCQRFRIPEGFEIIDAGSDDQFRVRPNINNCGQIVVGAGGTDGVSDPLQEVVLYENGALSLVTNDPSTVHNFADISDNGSITWTRGFDGIAAGEVLLLADAEATVLGNGASSAINNLDHLTWEDFSPIPPAFSSGIRFFDGQSISTASNDGMSNQLPRINNVDELTWTAFDFSAGGGFGGWRAVIRLYAEGVVLGLPDLDETPQPQLSDIDDGRRVGWSSKVGLEVWEAGATTLFMPDKAIIPSLNNRGSMAFLRREIIEPWQIWLDAGGTLRRISNNIDIPNIIDNGRPALNDVGEIAWWRKRNGTLFPSGIRYMRRIRDGDVDFDGDVDLSDATPMPACLTGPVPTDGLCDCRFFDIDHDRDIDHDDVDLFLRVYTGPLDDCDANGVFDVEELLRREASDCNFNGTLDRCEIAAGAAFDIDGDGILDACCERAAPSQPVPVVATSRYVSFTIEDPPPGPPMAMQGPPGDPQAVRVTFADLPGPFSAVNGQSMWVGEPRLIGENGASPSPRPGVATFMASTLECTPFFAHWENFGEVHVYHANIIPNGLYNIQAIAEGCGGSTASRAAGFGPRGLSSGVPPISSSRAARVPHPSLLAKGGGRTDQPSARGIHPSPTLASQGWGTRQDGTTAASGIDVNFSAPLIASTGIWADAAGLFIDGTWSPPDQSVDVTSDVVALLDKFASAPGAPPKVRADLEPATPDQKINITEVTRALDAFAGMAYPFDPVTNPCP